MQTYVPTAAAQPLSASTGIPSSLPRIIDPAGGPKAAPPNTTLIQVGFLQPLNYAFVAANLVSASQIFNFLPQGMAYGLGIPPGQVTMQTLQPYDTSVKLGYITTLATAYIPSDMVDHLSLDLHTPPSKMYNNPNGSTNTIMSMINPSVPIMAGSAFGGASGTDSSTAASSSAAVVQEGSPLGAGASNSSPVKGSSVGIGMGVVCGAAAYGAAMFFVARRYRKRRSSHQRTPSVLDSASMRSHGEAVGGASAALMSGGRADAVRSA
ncbi:MAG: hypothetical protein LQ347_005367, partial [Umbilicaria vellea]